MNGLIDFSSFPLGPRNLEYGGRGGEKKGIIFDGENYFLKFPKNTSGMENVKGLSYVTSPLSEYIGCHIYEMLGYDVQKTIFGICFDGKRFKPVCACRDFVLDDETLIPYTALRNEASPELMERNEKSSGSCSDLEDIVFQLDHNSVLSAIEGSKERFFDVLVIDMLINNNDRNEDNWGVIKKRSEGSYRLSPIYDCGNCFYGKTPDERVEGILSSPSRLFSSALNGVTAYELGGKGKNVRIDEILDFDNDDLRDSIRRVTPLVREKLSEISSFIMSIPSSFNDVFLISDERKSYYVETFKIRYDSLLLRKYQQLVG